MAWWSGASSRPPPRLWTRRGCGRSPLGTTRTARRRTAMRRPARLRWQRSLRVGDGNSKTVARKIPGASIGARKPSHGEFDAIAGEFAPGFDLRHVGRLGKAAEHFTRLFARFLARQRERLAPEGVARPRFERFGRAAGDVAGAVGPVHLHPPRKCNAECPIPRRPVGSISDSAMALLVLMGAPWPPNIYSATPIQ